MDKKIKIIIDSNHIYKLSSDRLINMIENYNELGDLYAPEVVIDELVQRDIDCVEEINIYRNKSTIIKHVINTRKIEEQLINDIRSYYIKLFNNKVIKISNIKIDEMYNRSLIKKPPFIDDKNASDKGFKDSLIWVSILEDSHEDYEEVILLSSDKSFIDNKESLEKEFSNKHNIGISFLRQLKKKSINETTPPSLSERGDNYLKTIEDFKKLESIREELEKILEKIISMRVYNDFGEYYEEQRFILLEKLEFIQLEKLIENLDSFIKENIMRNTVFPSEFLRVLGNIDLVNEKEEINTQDINDFYGLLYNANYDLGEYSESIMKAIIEYINNKTFKLDENPFSTTTDENLPF